MKGNESEIDSIRTLEKYRNQKGLFKNEQFFEDDHIMGTPDIINGDEIIDIKTPFDLFTFHKGEPLLSATSYTGYGWQLQGYASLAKCDFTTLSYVLVDSPNWIIESEVKKAWYQMNIDSPEEQDYFDTTIEPLIRANHLYTGLKDFPDIPLDERVIEYEAPFDQAAIDRVRTKVETINFYLKNDMDKIWK